MFEQPEPEFELVKLSDDARKALAKRVHGWLDSAELTKSTRLEARWKRNQEFYRDCPQNAVTNTVAGMPAMHFPLVSPRIDALGDAILDTVFKQSPVFMPEMSGESEDVDLAKAKPDYSQLDVHGVHQISVIIENYQKFFVDVTGKQVVDEWTAIKRMVVQKQQLMMMPFKRLWARMLLVSMLTAQFKFPVILRFKLVAIAMMLATGTCAHTSGCERLISRTSDLQTELR